MIALRYISSPLSFPALLSMAGRDCVRRFVRLVFWRHCDPAQENSLLPIWGLARSILPGVGGLPGAVKSSDDHRDGIRGERISEGHGQTLPDKKKYAMQKIILELFRNADKVSASTNRATQ